ncbi:dipeptide ABC transporter ATP-binding protein [Kitasatospora sp. NPDC057223]|uniref:dipeptide ABC transporter ATP-binding protein n=1 Tax=Kitasatospora sp. NPDC057223 TaxID=3346055 RepID=UPI0036379E6F
MTALPPHRPGHPATTPVLDIRDLNVSFGPRGRRAPVVQGVSLQVEPGQCLALVGESGSGKSVTARAVVGLAGTGAEVSAERLQVGGTDVPGLGARGLRHLRGTQVGFVLQDALVSLDPLRPVGREIADALRGAGLGPTRRRERVIELLTAAGVPEPERRARQRPGELSGGLRQRALIASALALDPPLLIADEPTTALDATVQRQILDLLEQLKAAGTAILLISHDLAVVDRIADRVAVMHEGRIVEQGESTTVLTRPAHDYTRRLIRAVPTGRPRGSRLSDRPAPAATEVLRRSRPSPVPATDPAAAGHGAPAPLLAVEKVGKNYQGPDGTSHQVLDGVGLQLEAGRTLGLVGESGSGKSTLARIVLGLTAPDTGTVTLDGLPWSALPERLRRPHRHRIGAVYQDPLGSFDPRLTVRQILTDALTVHAGPGNPGKGELDRRVAGLLDAVGLAATVADRRPARLSGGQRQRVAIARALAPGPELLVCDEAVSALDVSVQAQILDLLDDLQREFHLAYLFISHDLGVVQHMSDDIAVMTAGRIVETGPAADVFATPAHPYTRRLLDAAPRLPAAAAATE